MEGVAEAQFVGDLFDEFAFIVEAAGGHGHFQLHQVLVGALAVEAFEEPAEVGLIYMAGLGDVLQGLELEVVFADELPAGLVGGEGRGLRGGFGQGGFGDFQDQQFDQGRTDQRGESAAAGAVGDQVVENAENRLRTGRLNDGPGG